MPSLRPIRQKISSVKNTRKITSAMKMVSAAKLRRSQEVVENSKPYAAKIRSMMLNLSQGSAKEHSEFFKGRESVHNVVAIIITSDRGLCGGFNMNAIKQFLAFYAENTDKNIKVVVIGKKANDYVVSRNFEILESLIGLNSSVQFEQTAKIGKLVSEMYTSGQTDAVYCFYNEFVSTAVQRPRTERLLPLSFDVSAEEANKASDVHYEYEPEAEEILEHLVPQYINFSIYQRVLESFAGEHGARMMAMEAATKNAKELLESLNIKYNNLRQANITTELLDIVNGAEALK